MTDNITEEKLLARYQMGFVCMYVYVYVCECVCLCVCVCVYVCVCNTKVTQSLLNLFHVEKEGIQGANMETSFHRNW